MNGSAVVIMLAAMVIIWGGLLISVLFLRNHSRREDPDPNLES